jgi:hypothetical protein
MVTEALETEPGVTVQRAGPLTLVGEGKDESHLVARAEFGAAQVGGEVLL